jgi:predicted 3-demethylubiquinone-9 3-methyltransferase (glyoxalase superfamily)
MQMKTHVMFQGQADDALALYSAVFKALEVRVEARYGAGDALPEGAIKLATAEFAGHALIIFNSPPVHDFSFTPAVSLYVELDTAEALETAFQQLSQDGQILMPIGDYGFSARYGWLVDPYGLSWQLSLPHAG